MGKVLNKPKFKVGQKIEACWMWGYVTTHVITSIEETKFGYWYNWMDTDTNCTNGLHEIYLREAQNA